MEALKRLRASFTAYQSHLTKLYQKVKELLESSEPLNESQTTSLSTVVQKFSCKGETLRELDAKISETTENPEEFDTEVFEADDITIQYNS